MSVRYVALVLILVAASCARVNTEKGVEPTWRGPGAPTFESGVSSQAEVMEALGPPSQVISTDDGPIFYYLHESASGRGAIFIVYNQMEMKTRYDRAIFFFDRQGVLRDFAYSAAPDSE